MEPGTEREREAVREHWREIERRRRAADRLRVGAVLVLGGLALTVWGLPASACIDQGLWQHGCTAVVPLATRVLLLAGGPVAAAVGLGLCWRALRA